LRRCLEELRDPMLIILIVAGAVSIIAGTIEHPDDGWIEGINTARNLPRDHVSILFFVLAEITPGLAP